MARLYDNPSSKLIVHARTFLDKEVVMKINANSLTHFSSLGTLRFRKTCGARLLPKNKNMCFTQF